MRVTGSILVSSAYAGSLIFLGIPAFSELFTGRGVIIARFWRSLLRDRVTFPPVGPPGTFPRSHPASERLLPHSPIWGIRTAARRAGTGALLAANENMQTVHPQSGY